MNYDLSTFEKEILVKVFEGNPAARTFVGEAVIKYVDDFLTQDDCITCSLILEQKVTEILA